MLYESRCSLVTVFFSHDHSSAFPPSTITKWNTHQMQVVFNTLPRIIEHGHVTTLVVECYHATVHEPVPRLCHRLLACS
jgi:hypothetical protein